VEKEQHALEEHHAAKLKLESEEHEFEARASEHKKSTDHLHHELDSLKKIVDEKRAKISAEHMRKLTAWRKFSEEKAQAKEAAEKKEKRRRRT